MDVKMIWLMALMAALWLPVDVPVIDEYHINRDINDYA
jgi:hypothetical protein